LSLDEYLGVSVPGYRQVWTLQHDVELTFNLFGKPLIVCIEKRNICARGKTPSMVSRIRSAAVRIVTCITDAEVGCRRTDDVYCSLEIIITAVVDNDDLPWNMRLMLYRAQSSANRAR